MPFVLWSIEREAEMFLPVMDTSSFLFPLAKEAASLAAWAAYY